MSNPSAFDIGRQVSENFAPITERQIDRGIIDNILSQSKNRTPEEQYDLMGKIIGSVSPQNRDAAIQFLENKIQNERLLAQRRELGNQQYSVPGSGNQQYSVPGRENQYSAPGREIPRNIQEQRRPENERYQFSDISGTPSSIQNSAAQLAMQKPNLYRDPKDAVAQKEKEYNQIQSLLSNAENAFNKSLQDKLEGGPETVLDILSGDLKQDYLKELQDLVVNKNMNIQRAVDKITEKALDFAKARTNLAISSGASLFGLGPSGKLAQKKLSAIRREYEKNNKLELFEDDLVKKTGLSTPIAAFLAYPPSSNREINSYLRDTKKRVSLAPFQGSLVKGIKDKQNTGTKKRTEDQIANYIKDNLRTTDSLNSIAVAFNAKGYDPQKILDNIQEWNDRTSSLNKRQERDLQKRSTFRATLQDIAYFLWMGLNTKEIVNE